MDFDREKLRKEVIVFENVPLDKRLKIKEILEAADEFIYSSLFIHY